mmetsp:Transcript_8350/g.9696  ORF Transcript_8350/g.9696 Transcript_8350/m.9696 type:complete len:122 (+) Transcript_8350:645-1010(+)
MDRDHLRDPFESFENDPASARHFHDSKDFEIERFCSLLNADATDQVNGIQSVMEKTLNTKRHAYHDAAENCERLEAQQATCLSEVEGHEKRIEGLEDERADIATALKNIQNLQECTNDLRK